MKVREAIEEYRYYITKHSEQTQEWYLGKLKVFDAWCTGEGLQLEDLRPSHIARFLDSVRQRTNPRTKQPVTTHLVHGYARAVKVFLNWASREEGIEDHVSQRLPRRIPMPKMEEKVIETLSAEQVKRMMIACDQGDNQEMVMRDRAIVALLIDTGIRANELCTLTLDNVYITSHDGYLKIYGKGSKWREVGLGEKSRAALHRFITRYRRAPRDEKHVFLSRVTGKCLSVTGLEQLLYRLKDKARLQPTVRVNPHVWRHTYAMTYLLNGGDVYKLSRLMGHTSVTITEGYLRAVKAKDARSGQSVLDSLR